MAFIDIFLFYFHVEYKETINVRIKQGRNKDNQELKQRNR